MISSKLGKGLQLAPDLTWYYEYAKVWPLPVEKYLTFVFELEVIDNGKYIEYVLTAFPEPLLPLPTVFWKFQLQLETHHICVNTQNGMYFTPDENSCRGV